MTKSTIGKISALLKTGKTPPSKNQAYFERDYNWYTPGDIGENKFLNGSERHISKLAVEDKKATLYPEKSLLLTCIGNIGRVGISNEKVASNQQITAIKPIDKVNVEYLYYWFIKNQKLLSDKSNNAVVPILNNKTLKAIPFSYPNPKTQQKIAQILDNAAALRDKTAQLLEEYELLAQSIFLELFGDPCHNSKDFEKVKINYFIKKLETGKSVNSTNEVYSTDKLGILKTSCVYTGTFNPMEAKVIKDSEIQLAKLNPKKDSIIISRMNTEELVGKSAYVFKDFDNLFLPDRLWQTVKSEIKHSVLWLSYAISQDSFMGSISRVSTGTSGSMKNISQKNFLNLEIIHPPIELQTQFAQKIALIERQKELAKQELNESEYLFNCLLQKAFKGEL